MGSRVVEALKVALGGRRGCGCEACPLAAPATQRRVFLVGPPNVGKSVLFNHLTGSYAVVSNYPGTTVEVARGRARIGDAWVEVVDTPGAYSLAAFSEDEAVTERLICEEPADLVVHVVDAKQLHRALPFVIEMIETGLPVALDVNILDEAGRAGLEVDLDTLGRALGIPVVGTAATSGIGIERLRGLVAGQPPARSGLRVDYPTVIEEAIASIEERLEGGYRLSRRAVALLLLRRDRLGFEMVGQRDPQTTAEVERIVAAAEARFPQPLVFAITVARREAAERVARRSLQVRPTPLRPPLSETLGRLAMHPAAGLPMLAAVLALMYLVVGRLGAGVVVDFLDRRLFLQYVNPAVTALVERALPWRAVSSLLVGEYGVLTLGLRYALAIVLPLVAAFFLLFAVLEDSGYLPRLAMLVDRVFKAIGLSGRAVIPMVLGLGCDTMATVVTRMLETRRERVIATFLLALAIPCSAQLGVILGLLSVHPLGLVIWAGVVLGVFLVSGVLAARLVPGVAPRFHLEIPPLRWPAPRNVAVKTYLRLKWYAAEVIPLFLLVSVFIWFGELIRVFPLLVAALELPVRAIGLPAEAADAFLFGFLRRDYGAARLFDASAGGGLSGVSLVVAMVTITLFIPCLAQFMVMQKERGLRTALAVGAIILPLSFGVGFVLNATLTALRVQI